MTEDTQLENPSLKHSDFWKSGAGVLAMYPVAYVVIVSVVETVGALQPEGLKTVVDVFRSGHLDFFWLNLESDRGFFAKVGSVAFDRYYLEVILSVYSSLAITLYADFFVAWKGRSMASDPSTSLGKPRPWKVFLAGVLFISVIFLMEFVAFADVGAPGKSWVLMPLRAFGIPFIGLDLFYIFGMGFALLSVLSVFLSIIGIRIPIRCWPRSQKNN